MLFNELLISNNIRLEDVLVLRHRPTEPALNRIFPMLVGERPDLFRTYESAQNEKLERVMAGMVGSGYVASFIAHGPGRALFTGVSKIATVKPISFEEYWQKPGNIELRSLGMTGVRDERPSVLWFDMIQVDFHTSWIGKLIVDWPPPERSWWRRAHKNQFAVHAILEESAFDVAMKDSREIDLTWAQLAVLPTRWRAKLAEWRAIYYIFDKSDGLGYVGAAYGSENLLGRWLNYAASGHGGNRLLRQRDPQNFHFSILERVSPDMEADDVIRLEATWKERLHTRAPHGLNEN
jgi:hypothetical protein